MRVASLLRGTDLARHPSAGIPLLRRPGLGLALLGAVVVGTPLAPARAEGPIPIKVATLAPEGTAWIKILRASLKETEKRLPGRVKFTVYGGGVQGDEKVVVQKIKTGQLQGGALTLIGLSSLVPEMTLFNLPMVFSSKAQVAATQKALSERLAEDLWESGFKMVNWGGAGFFYLFSAHPIHHPDDLKKGKVWVWNTDPVFNEMALEIGAAPIPLGLPDVLSALNTGQVDTVLMNPYALISLQWFAKMKYQLSEPILYAIGGMVIHRSVWEQFTPAEHDIFLEVSKKWERVLSKKSDRDKQRSVDFLEGQGVEVITPSTEELAAWRSVSSRTRKRLVGRVYSEEVLTELLHYRDLYRTSSTP